MKKLLFLLLFPLLVIGQNTTATYWGKTGYSDGVKLNWQFAGTEAAPVDISEVKTGDTVIMFITLTNARYGTNDVRYFHLDVNINQDLFDIKSENWLDVPQDSQLSISADNGVMYTAADPTRQYDLDHQWNNPGTYTSGTNWTVRHYQVQTVQGRLPATGNGNSVLALYLTVKSVPEAFDFSVPAVKMFAGKANDPASGWTFEWGGGITTNPSGAFTIQVDDNVYASGAKIQYKYHNLDPTTFKPYLYELTSENSWGNPQGPLMVSAAGLVDLSQLTVIEGKQYAIITHVQDGAAFRILYDDIVTISDVALLFKALGESGLSHNELNSTLSSAIQISNGDLDYNGAITEQDTYRLLAHVLGVTLIEETLQNGAWAANGGVNLYYGVFGAYSETEYAKVNTGNSDNNISGGHLAKIDFNFLVTDQIIPLYVAIKGDVNLSHSAVLIPENISGKSVKAYGETKKVVADVIGSFVTELVDGKVIATIQLPVDADLSSAQVKLAYDTSKLTFDQAKMDTGNTTTNFAKQTEGYINIGGINLEKSKIENGVITLQFTPKVTLTNTIGLVSITNTDASDMNADRLNLILE